MASPLYGFSYASSYVLHQNFFYTGYRYMVSPLYDFLYAFSVFPPVKKIFHTDHRDMVFTCMSSYMFVQVYYVISTIISTHITLLPPCITCITCAFSYYIISTLISTLITLLPHVMTLHVSLATMLLVPIIITHNIAPHLMTLHVSLAIMSFVPLRAHTSHYSSHCSPMY